MLLGKLFGKMYLEVMGWKIEGALPDLKKYVLIAAPHTSSWDMPNMLYIAWALGLKLSWMGKKSLFQFPFGPWMRYVGGVAIDRSRRTAVVQQIAEQFKQRDEMALAIAPEGTRGAGEGWKSGFYHIARTADVPIVMGFLDYSRKRGGVGPIIHPTGDMKADMDKIRAFYTPEMSHYPNKFRVPRLREEADLEPTASPIPGLGDVRHNDANPPKPTLD